MPGDGVDLREVDRWCRLHIGAGIVKTIFVTHHLSTVFGVELSSRQRVVVKIRLFTERLVGCVAVHRRLFEAGFPCPAPIVDLENFGEGGLVASAETMVDGGQVLPASGRRAAPFAKGLARLVELAPAVEAVPSLAPAPPWTLPDFDSSELWPPPDDFEADLNTVEGPAWLDEAGAVARARLSEASLAPVVGHGDWYTENLRWAGETLQAVFDWDGVVALPEAVIAGLAAAAFPATVPGTEATVTESESFLEAYQSARGRAFGNDELEVAWAASLWTRSFDAKKHFARHGLPQSLGEAEATERRRRAGDPGGQPR